MASGIDRLQSLDQRGRDVLHRLHPQPVPDLHGPLHPDPGPAAVHGVDHQAHGAVAGGRRLVHICSHFLLTHHDRPPHGAPEQRVQHSGGQKGNCTFTGPLRY